MHTLRQAYVGKAKRERGHREGETPAGFGTRSVHPLRHAARRVSALIARTPLNCRSRRPVRRPGIEKRAVAVAYKLAGVFRLMGAFALWADWQVRRNSDVWAAKVAPLCW